MKWILRKVRDSLWWRATTAGTPTRSDKNCPVELKMSVSGLNPSSHPAIRSTCSGPKRLTFINASMKTRKASSVGTRPAEVCG